MISFILETLEDAKIICSIYKDLTDKECVHFTRYFEESTYFKLPTLVWIDLEQEYMTHQYADEGTLEEFCRDTKYEEIYKSVVDHHGFKEKYPEYFL